MSSSNDSHLMGLRGMDLPPIGSFSGKGSVSAKGRLLRLDNEIAQLTPSSDPSTWRNRFKNAVDLLDNTGSVYAELYQRDMA